MRLKDSISLIIKLNELRKRPIVRRGGLPDFHIIGSQKCATSSLFRYLSSHPRVYGPYKKEIQYYSLNYEKGIEWYKQFFPAYSPKKERLRLISGEASPYYIYHPKAAEWIKKDTPNAKLILIMRDPVKRAYSHYAHNTRPDLDEEKLSFEEALHQEEARIEKDYHLILEHDYYYSYHHHRHGYKARGRYLEQIKRYHAIFPKEQLLIITTEDFYKDRQEIMNKVCDHLELERHEFKTLWKFNTGSYKAPIKEETKQLLIDYFRPYNEELYNYLGRDFGWMR
jgi:hypothetical protein